MKIIRQVSSSGRETMKSLSFEIESFVYKHVKENFPSHWSKDHITRGLFSEIKKSLHGRIIYTGGGTLRTFWHLHRIKDGIEDICADMGIVVRLSFHDGQTATGVAIFDIAEKDAGKNSFSSLNKSKYKKILHLAPHAQLLLYDYDAITGMALPVSAESVIGSYPHSWNNWMPFTHAVTLPACAALALDAKTTSLYKISLPLSYQILYRYLYGIDLDFSPLAIETASGIRNDRGNPAFLILISVAHGGGEQLTTFDFDNHKYIEFE